MVWFFEKTNKVSETSFAKFIRDASSGDKKRVYQRVLKDATEQQVKVIEQAYRARDVRHAEAKDSEE